MYNIRLVSTRENRQLESIEAPRKKDLTPQRQVFSSLSDFFQILTQVSQAVGNALEAVLGTLELQAHPTVVAGLFQDSETPSKPISFAFSTTSAWVICPLQIAWEKE